MKILSKICIGSANFGLKYGIINNKKIKNSEIKKCLKTLRCNHISYIDTAVGYGDAEKNLGSIGVQDFKIITKIPSITLSQGELNQWLINKIKNSLKLINIKSLYAVLMHRPSDLLSENGQVLFNSLAQMKKSGLIKKIGVSIYSYTELKEIINNFNIDIVQAPYNIFDNNIEQTGWLDTLYEKNIEVHTRSTFLQGILLHKTKKLPEYFEKWKNLFANFDDYVNEKKISKLDLCLINSLHNKKISKVIIGIDSNDQLVSIINSAKKINKSRIFIPPILRCSDQGLINPSNWP